MRRKKVIQVGVGGFGLSWLEILSKNDLIEVIGVVEIIQENRDKASKILASKTIEYFDDYKEAFQQLSADIAVIITPPQTHKEIAHEALKHNLHVFMEKPIAHNVEDALELKKIAKNYDKHVMISQNYRYRPSILALKEAIEKDLVGEIEYVEWDFRRASKFGGWRDHYEEIMLEDMSIHHFDLMRYLLKKKATTVYAKSMHPSWSWFKGNPTTSLTMTFNNVLVNYFASWVTSGPETSWNGNIMLYGKKGVLSLENDIVYFLKGNDKKEKLPLIPLAGEDRELSIKELVHAMEEDRKPITDIADNIYSFQVVSAALKSIDSRTEINVEEYMKKMEGET